MKRAAILKYVYEVRSSYWFIPSLMAVAAIGISIVTVGLDHSLHGDWPGKLPFIYSNRPDAARSLLATVAGSMITVAGVTFSLTLLAVSHATSQFGPRLLTNFMRDRGNQITLGTFIATFLYCLLVLRTVRTAEEGDAADLMAAFVPQLSITCALLMTLASVAVLIYFIHHIPESIHLSHVVAEVGHELTDALDELFPEPIGRDAADAEKSAAAALPERFDQEAVRISDDDAGYVQAMNDEGLLEVAEEFELTVRLHCRPGDFVCAGQTRFSAWPPHCVTDEAAAQLRSSVAYGTSRTPAQNALFLVDQLVEVAARALSPGVNDPFTANTCLDWLGNALVRLAGRRDPNPARCNESGTLRIVAPTTDFAGVCEAVFGQLRPYVATDRNAAFHMLGVIENVMQAVTTPSRRAVLRMHAEHLLQASQQSHFHEHDQQRLQEQQRRIASAEPSSPSSG